MSRDVQFPIASEEVEPTAAMIIGRLFARCEAAKGDRNKMEDACAGLWMAVLGFQNLSIAIKTATHFSVAVSNHMRVISDYIEAEIQIDPMKQWKW